jgi:hypothetical protein
MNSYYYFVASLPFLSPGQKSPISSEFFLGECARLMDATDAYAVRLAFAEEDAEGFLPGVAGAWLRFRHDMKNELAYARALRAKRDPQKYVRGERSADARLQAVVTEALSARNPHEAQRVIDKASWTFLEEVAIGHSFDTDALVIYGLKLKILEREEAVASPRGQSVFQGYLSDSRLDNVYAAVRG